MTSFETRRLIQTNAIAEDLHTNGFVLLKLCDANRSQIAFYSDLCKRFFNQSPIEQLTPQILIDDTTDFDIDANSNATLTYHSLSECSWVTQVPEVYKPYLSDEEEISLKIVQDHSEKFFHILKGVSHGVLKALQLYLRLKLNGGDRRKRSCAISDDYLSQFVVSPVVTAKERRNSDSDNESAPSSPMDSTVLKHDLKIQKMAEPIANQLQMAEATSYCNDLLSIFIPKINCDSLEFIFDPSAQSTTKSESAPPKKVLNINQIAAQTKADCVIIGGALLQKISLSFYPATIYRRFINDISSNVSSNVNIAFDLKPNPTAIIDLHSLQSILSKTLAKSSAHSLEEMKENWVSEIAPPLFQSDLIVQSAKSKPLKTEDFMATFGQWFDKYEIFDYLTADELNYICQYKNTDYQKFKSITEPESQSNSIQYSVIFLSLISLIVVLIAIFVHFFMD